ncbi:MAG: class I SAM-dependent methyltransferase [Candidatus Zambryskibacteria bacterium]|nr:class I SAM-dependent methyltransferase [Candidatus Zambryskibacteria bacterium]
MNDRTKRNNFGILSKDYDAARRGYPKELFAYLKKLVPGKHLKVLDIGCGTGISTRQLKERGFSVTGVDKDQAMVAIARQKTSDILYVVTDVHKLPFDNEEFDLITAFTSFHWFTDRKSTTEIKRVLKRGGVFFTVWKKSSKSKSERVRNLGIVYNAILEKYFGDNSDSARNYNPEAILKKNNFTNIKVKSFYFQEKYTLQNAMTLVKSISNWNLLKEDLRPKFLKNIEDLYKKNLVGGFVIKNREAKVVLGTK